MAEDAEEARERAESERIKENEAMAMEIGGNYGDYKNDYKNDYSERLQERRDKGN